MVLLRYRHLRRTVARRHLFHKALHAATFSCLSRHNATRATVVRRASRRALTATQCAATPYRRYPRTCVSRSQFDAIFASAITSKIA